MGTSLNRKEAPVGAEGRPRSAIDAWTEGWPLSQGDFERLVDAFMQPLVQYAFRRLGNLHDAEDVVQEVFVRCYARRMECARVAPVAPYLYRMAGNACTDVLRKRGRGEAPWESRAIDEIPSGAPSASMRCTAAEELQRAEALIGRLPRKQAEAIRLRTYDNLSLTEIAQVLECSPNTIGSRLRYGFQKLRKLASKEWTR